MASAYLDFLRECESITVDSFVLTRFEINPKDCPDSRLCWSDRTGYYLVSLVGEVGWQREAQIRQRLVQRKHGAPTAAKR